jgi:hypothetical protein
MLRIEPISRNKQRRSCDKFTSTTLPLLPAAQRDLLKEWLKSSTPARSWTALLRIAGSMRIETAESLMEALIVNGAAAVEERFGNAHWQPMKLIWQDYEALCAAIGLATASTKRHAFFAAWDAVQSTVWQNGALEVAYHSLRDGQPERGQLRLGLLLSLNEWLLAERSGTRREFALSARGQTKQITNAEWVWLSEQIDLSACGIEKHTPALWLAGPIQFDIGGKQLDISAAGDFVGLTLRTFERLTAGRTSAAHYRLVENRTSFENVARKVCTDSNEVVIWLPGYAPSWWCTCVKMLLAAVPLPAQISCDADPDGVQIALHVGLLWQEKDLPWTAEAMDVHHLVQSPNKLPLTEHDARLAQSLLSRPDLPRELNDLLRFSLEHRVKAEQENWL